MGADERGVEQLTSSARFAVDPAAVAGEEVAFPPEVARQMSRVLRFSPGRVVAILVEGRELAVRLEEVNAGRARGKVLGPVDRFTEPRLTVVLVQAVLKGDRTDLVVQKATELGVSAIFPVITARTVARPAGSAAGRQRRWEKIAREAAEQSLRLRVPRIFPPREFVPALRQIKELYPGAQFIALWEEERETGLLDLLAVGATEIVLLMGPEGGWEEREMQETRALGGRTASLGVRLLRSETAALVALTLAMASRGELGRAPLGRERKP